VLSLNSPIHPPRIGSDFQLSDLTSTRAFTRCGVLRCDGGPEVDATRALWPNQLGRCWILDQALAIRWRGFANEGSKVQVYYLTYRELPSLLTSCPISWIT